MKYKAMYLNEKKKTDKLECLVQEAFIQGSVRTKPEPTLTWQQAWLKSPVLRDLKELKEGK